MMLAIVIPFYNERETLRAVVERILATAVPEGAGVRRRIYLVDDASTDGSGAIAAQLAALPDAGPVTVISHDRNRGKGAALRTGFARALTDGADAVLVHDADLEYDPADHAALIRPILDGRADAVIGSRFLGQTHRVLYFWHSIANRALTLLSNMLTNLNLTDIECCSKAVRAEVLRHITLREDRFGVEPELIAKLARARGADGRRARIYEVPVGYSGRTYAEGKKITWRDGFSAVRCIIRYGLFR